MKNPRIAILSFPGTNGDTENLRVLKRTGFDPFVFRWNDDRTKLADVSGYFLGAGFSYEDRGRAGMVAARDSLFQFLHEESAKGKMIVGHCNGCQVLIESGLVPLGQELTMSMARNTVSGDAVGFLNEWVWVKPVCKRGRCATSDWINADGTPYEQPLQMPIAHGEGRFVTKDPDLLAELQKNDQIAFQYCDAAGNVSADAPITPNSSTMGIAGLCNPAGNVVAIMPHPERTENADVYFRSMRKWVEGGKKQSDMCVVEGVVRMRCSASLQQVKEHTTHSTELFIDTIIVNNEERTVEQAARRLQANISLKQFRYLAPTSKKPEEILQSISLFNPNKEIAYLRKKNAWQKWNADTKSFSDTSSPLRSITLLRRDEPDTGAAAIGGGETGVCYSCDGVREDVPSKLQEIFANPHASTLSVLTK